ncbi:sin3 histone deacetylase corepressor complex component sds3-like [Nannochloropsis oceanica]
MFRMSSSTMTEGGTSGEDTRTETGTRKRKLEEGEGEEQPPNKMATAEESEGRGISTGGGGANCNPSSISTASSSAAAAADDAAARGKPDRNRELIDRITEVETEKQLIEQGTHPEWQKKLDALQKVRDRRVFAAERFKQMQVENIQGLYEYEVLEAEGSYKAAMDELKTRLLDTMEQRVKRLEEDRERVMKQLERVGQTRMLRSKSVFRADGHLEAEGLNRAGARAGVGEGGGEVVGGNVSMFLSDGEIKDDLRQISTDLAERARSYYDSQSDVMVEVSVEDNCLHYNDHCLLKGESIIFTSMLSGEDFVGRIASVRPHEILVKLSDGTKARIHMSYLRNGRIKLKCEGDATEA